ncbi:hypothetical protein BJV78DRAFT_782009 [Lactifluus subvellereus]|nr:hypothetical protein BJV78DRAFT_782009 [Lactifluus subvellereus]
MREVGDPLFSFRRMEIHSRRSRDEHWFEGRQATSSLSLLETCRGSGCGNLGHTHAHPCRRAQGTRGVLSGAHERLQCALARSSPWSGLPRLCARMALRARRVACLSISSCDTLPRILKWEKIKPRASKRRQCCLRSGHGLSGAERRAGPGKKYY